MVTKREALGALRRAKAEVEEAWLRGESMRAVLPAPAQPPGAPPAAPAAPPAEAPGGDRRVFEEVLKRLETLEKNAATAEKDTDWGELEEEAQRLGRLRAFVLPSISLTTEAQALLGEMEGWRVPQPIIDSYSVLRDGKSSTNELPELEKRAGLNRLLDDYDYWDGYSDWFVSRRVALALLGLVVAVLGLLSAHSALSMRHLFSGLIAAATAGAAVSIVTKLPEMSVYGDFTSFWVKAITRLVVGITAGAIACGVLSLGIFTVTMPADSGSTLLDVINACSPEVPQVALRTSADAGVPDAGLDDAGVPDAGVVDAGIGGAAPAPSPPPPSPCLPRFVYILLALGVLLGFSERFLTTVEGALLPENGTKGGK